MCVIFIADKTRPTEEMVEKGYSANPSGAGAAWRENGKVYWAKGLKLAELQDLALKVPLPAVFHCRIPTCGGAKDELCHPFPIQRDVPLTLRGVTTGAVLFHNGHWNQWKDRVLNTLERRNKEMPPGRWSDTRAMAFYAAYFGVAALEMMDEKCVAFGPKMCEIYGSGWSKVNDIWCSNTHWDHVSSSVHSGYHGMTTRMCTERRCSKNRLGTSEYCYEHRNLGEAPSVSTFPNRQPKAGGTSAAEKFREGTGTVPVGGDQQEGTEQAAAEVGQGDKGVEAGADSLKEEKGDKGEEGSALSVSRRDEDTPPWFRAFNPKRFRSSARSSSTSPILPDGDLAERRRAADKGITRVGPI